MKSSDNLLIETSGSSSTETIDLKQYWLAFKRHWLLASSIFLLFVVCSTTAGWLKKPFYQAEGKLLIRKVSSTSSLTGIGQQIGELESVERQGSPLDTEIEIILSVPMIQKTIAQLNLEDENGNQITREQVLRNLSVTKVKAGDILQVAYENTDPEDSAAVVNTLMKIYLENNIIVNRDEALTAREFIEKQLPEAKDNVNRAQADLRQFEEENQIFALEEEIKSLASQTDNLQKQIFQAQASLTNVNNKSEVQALVQQLQKVQSQLAIERERFTATNPTVIDLENQVAALEEVLQAQTNKVAGKEEQNLKSLINTLSNLKALSKQKSKILPVLKQEQKKLERKLETAQVNYLQLLQKRQDIQFTENQNFVNARIISPARVPNKSAFSYISLYSSLGVLLGSVTAIATILLLEQPKQSTFRILTAAKQHLGFTMLAMIPAVENKTKMLPSSFSSENIVTNFLNSPNYGAYLMLQRNLHSSIYQKGLNMIVVTSFSAQEDQSKSKVSANLALTMSQLGNKVLLVDANLLCPLQHHVWNLPNHFGLSEILLKVECQLETTKIMNNLDVITSGGFVGNSTALLNSSSMVCLIEQFSNNYDFVIFDTPSLKDSFDACILGSMSDGILLVTETKTFEPNIASWAKELLVQFNQNVLGMVLIN